MFTRRLARQTGRPAGFRGVIASLFGNAPAKPFNVQRTEEDWLRHLSPEQFSVLRQHATERPFSSPLDKHFHDGDYACAGCGQQIFSSATKFDSGTGWPSFWQARDGAVGTTTDYHLLIPRTEVHCSRCGGHLGHVFADGPPPTGRRYCINGLALSFTPSHQA